MPSLEDIAEEGVAGGGGEELEEGPDGERNLGLLVILLAPELPDSLRMAAVALLVPSAGETGGMAGLFEGGVLLPPWGPGVPAPPLLGLLSPNLSLYKAAEEPRLLFPLDFCC